MSRLMQFAVIPVSLVLLFSPCQLKAEENTAGAPVKEEIKSDNMTPVEALKQNTDELLKDLSDDDLTFVYGARVRDGVIRAVEYTNKMVSGAVTECGIAQPDMKENLDSRYQSWWGVLEPLLKESEDYLNTTIEARNSVSADELKEHLKLVHEAAEYTNSKIEKQFVTDRDACEYLLVNMDLTENGLKTQLLKTMETIPFPDIYISKGQEE